MPWRIDEVEVVDLAVERLVMKRSSLGLDGYPTLFLDVHRVQHLRLHVAGLKAATTLDQSICKC